MNDAETALKNAQSKTQQLNDQLQSVNTITVPDGYYEALKNYIDYDGRSDWNSSVAKQLSKKVYQYRDAGYSENQYKHNKTEENESVDYNNLTTDQQKELSLFAADLINQIRQQVGTDQVKVTPNSIAFGNKIIKEGYNDPSWDVFGSHMTNGQGHNIPYFNSLNMGVAENAGGSLASWHYNDNGQLVKNSIAPQTMDSLKETIYNTIRGMMFADGNSGWGHAANFADYGTVVSNPTLGFGFDKYGYTHFDILNADLSNHLSDNPYTIPSNSELIAEYNNAKNDQAAKQSAFDSAKSTNDTAQKALSDAKADKQVEDNNVASAQANLTKAESTLSDTSNGLTNAQNALVQAQAVQASAQQAVDNLSADLKTKQAAVNKASQELNAAKTALSDAQSNLNAKQSSVKNATEALNQAKQAVAAAQQAIDNANAKARQVKNTLEQAKKNTQTAQNALQTAKDQLTTDQKTQANAQKAVDNFNADQATKQAAVNKAQQTLDQANNQLAVAKNALDQATQKLASLQKVAANKAQVVTTAKETVKDDQAKLIDLNNHLADMKNAPAKLAAAKQAASQAVQVLADAKAELQKQQDALAPFTEAIKAAQAKVATAQKTADQANQAVKEAQSNLDQANNKLADAKMTDAQRYGKEVVVNPVSLTAGDQVPSPKLANALTLNDNNGFAVVVNNGTAAELPAGTTAQWANEVQVQADANNAGSYTEEVLVTFPDGSQTIVKAQMTVTAKKTNGQANETRLASTASNTVNSFESNNAKSAYTSNTDSNIMTREAYKASQKNQNGKLPQTSASEGNGLIALGLVLVSLTASLFGLRKSSN